jgi:hypothetical protein
MAKQELKNGPEIGWTRWELELAMLAATIDREMSVTDPEGAVRVALRLLEACHQVQAFPETLEETTQRLLRRGK